MQLTRDHRIIQKARREMELWMAACYTTMNDLLPAVCWWHDRVELALYASGEYGAFELRGDRGLHDVFILVSFA